MKNLTQIYQQLSSGKLDRAGAFELIKAMKQQDSKSLLAAPVWQPGEITPTGDTYNQHYIVVCDFKAVNVERLQELLQKKKEQSQCQSINSESKGVTSQDIAQRYNETALACFDAVQKVLQSKPRGKVLLQLVINDNLLNGLSGLLKTAMLENPQLQAQLILTDSQISTPALAAQLQQEQTAQDTQVKYDQEKRLVLNWQEVKPTEQQNPIVFKEHGVYLITGGLGGLGSLFANEILQQTAKTRVILTGRSALTDETSLPERVEYQQLDLTNFDKVSELINGI
ncbi:MAG: KR domain-containing protein, partial [Algicola sp.]|nr:KR domain-containing protein [Algicola sp.]